MVQDCVFAPSSELQFSFWRKNGFNPGSAGMEFGERTGITLVCRFGVQRKASSFLLTLAGSGFGVRTGPNPGLAGLEFGERPVLSPNSEPWQVRCSEKEAGPTLVQSSEKGQGRTLVVLRLCCLHLPQC